VRFCGEMGATFGRRKQLMRAAAGQGQTGTGQR
jgi:hypothetical protein